MAGPVGEPKPPERPSEPPEDQVKLEISSGGRLHKIRNTFLAFLWRITGKPITGEYSFGNYKSKTEKIDNIVKALKSSPEFEPKQIKIIRSGLEKLSLKELDKIEDENLRGISQLSFRELSSIFSEKGRLIIFFDELSSIKGTHPEAANPGALKTVALLLSKTRFDADKRKLILEILNKFYFFPEETTKTKNILINFLKKSEIEYLNRLNEKSSEIPEIMDKRLENYKKILTQEEKLSTVDTQLVKELNELLNEQIFKTLPPEIRLNEIFNKIYISKTLESLEKR